MLKNRGKGSMNETILLIEDNESIIMGLEYLLTEEQYTFLAAKTKKEAQDLLASRQVDLVLLDVSLPDGNGFDLCRKIKEHDIAPVIFLTAKDEEKDVVLGFDLGGLCDQTVSKSGIGVAHPQCAAQDRKNPAADLWKYCGGTGHGQSLSGRGTDRGDKARIQNSYDFIFQSA